MLSLRACRFLADDSTLTSFFLRGRPRRPDLSTVTGQPGRVSEQAWRDSLVTLPGVAENVVQRLPRKSRLRDVLDSVDEDAVEREDDEGERDNRNLARAGNVGC